MSHDPLCPLRDPQYEAEWCHDCRVIAKVRADEREQAAQRVEELGCNDACGCSITIPNAAAAVRGEP
jgi:hypothetical protein